MKAKEILYEAQKEYPFEIEEVDITKDLSLYELYKYAIPVVFINGKEVFRYNVEKERLKEILKKAK